MNLLSPLRKAVEEAFFGGCCDGLQRFDKFMAGALHNPPDSIQNDATEAGREEVRGTEASGPLAALVDQLRSPKVQNALPSVEDKSQHNSRRPQKRADNDRLG